MAEQACEGIGAHLAMIKSIPLYLKIQKYLLDTISFENRANVQHVWLGATYNVSFKCT